VAAHRMADEHLSARRGSLGPIAPEGFQIADSRPPSFTYANREYFHGSFFNTRLGCLYEIE
jgi:hypothetical protein